MGRFKNNYFQESDYTQIQEEIKEILLAEGWVLHYNNNLNEAVEEKEDDEDVDINDFCLYTEEDVDYESEDGQLNEFLFKKMVVRGGKKIKKWFSSDPRMQVVPNPSGGKPTLRIKKSAEKIKRKKGALRAKIKRAVKKAQSNLRRKLSQRKRSIFGLK